MNIAQQMLPDNCLRIRRLVVFAEDDWEMIGDVFDEHQFRALFVGLLVRSYCNWLRSKGITTKEEREASGLTIEDFIKQAKSIATDVAKEDEQTLTKLQS
jgi:hypothetical protein